MPATRALVEKAAQVAFSVLVLLLCAQTATATPPTDPGADERLGNTMTAFYAADTPPGTTEVLWHSLREHWSNPYRPSSLLHPPRAGHTHQPGQPRRAHPFIPRHPWQCVTPARLNAETSTNTGCAITVLTEYGPKVCLVVTMGGVVFLMYVED